LPTFCRHHRFIQNCPICREPEPPRGPARRAAGGATAARSRGAGSGVKVRRVARAADDGYRSPLVPGLRSSDDARRLAAEIAFSAARLGALGADPPGLYAEAASEADREEALWLVTLVSLLGPLAGDDPFAGIRALRVPWAAGGTPSLEGVALGPRAGVADAEAAQRALDAYRAWAQRSGGQAAALLGAAGWSAERRFDRAFERIGALPGFARPARYDLLLAHGRLGLAEVRASGLHFDGDDASLAARRVFGIADRFLLERRARDLAGACEAPIEALDLALANFGRDGARITQGATGIEEDEAVRTLALDALGVD